MGLTVSGVSVTTTLQRFLIQRVDEQLDQATNGWAHRSGLVDGNSGTQSEQNNSDTQNEQESDGISGSSSGHSLGLEGFGAIWVTCATAQKVMAVNPERREVIRSLPIEGTTYGLAVGEGLVWAASEGAGLLLPIRPR